MIKYVKAMIRSRAGRDMLAMLIAMYEVAGAEFYFLVQDDTIKTFITAAVGIALAVFMYRSVLPRWEASNKEDKED